jgi:hypothetical protein
MRRASCSGWFADRPPLAGFVSGVLMLTSFVGDLVPLPLLACAGPDFPGWLLLLSLATQNAWVTVHRTRLFGLSFDL